MPAEPFVVAAAPLPGYCPCGTRAELGRIRCASCDVRTHAREDVDRLSWKIRDLTEQMKQVEDALLPGKVRQGCACDGATDCSSCALRLTACTDLEISQKALVTVFEGLQKMQVQLGTLAPNGADDVQRKVAESEAKALAARQAEEAARKPPEPLNFEPVPRAGATD